MMGRILTPAMSLAIIVFVMAAVCIPPGEAPAEQTGTFTGTWTASGEWQPLDFNADREVFIYKLSGHVNLKNSIGEVADFWSECVGLWDSETGGSVRCVWRDTDNKNVAYIVLEGQLVKKDVKVSGEFVGGTGELKGLTGRLSFTWSSVFRDRAERILTGYTRDLSGSYRVPKVEN